MGRNSHDDMDLRKIRRLLRETTRLAERASMTGSLQGGGRIAIRQYNAIRNHLQDSGVIPEDLFQELDEDEATFDELGVVTGMLESFLEDEDEVSADSDGEKGPEDGDSRRGRRWKRHGPWGPEAARFWGDPQALRDLQELGEVMREHLPELLKMRETMRPGYPPTPPTPPTPPHPPQPHAPRSPQSTTSRRPGEESEPAPPPATATGWSSAAGVEVVARIREISEELQREDLDFARRVELSRKLAELANGTRA
jgi:hypothetical protein